MKLIMFFSLSLFVGLACCDNKSSFQKSYSVWQSLKLKDYSYTAYKQPGYARITATTNITVVNNTVVERSFFREAYEVITDDWIENEPADIGTHERASAAITLDEVYSRCINDILSQDPKYNYISFKATDNDLISSCTYSPKEIMDYPSTGFFIRDIKY